MACEDGLGVQVALGRRLAAEGVGLVGHAHVQGVAVEVGVDGDGADAQLAAGPDDPDGDLAAVGNEDLLEHAGLSSVIVGLHNCTHPYGVCHVGRWSGTSAGCDEVDSTNTYLLDQARHGAPRRAGGGGRPPDGRAGAARPALGVAARREPAGLGAPAARLRRPTTSTCAPGRWRWPAADACRRRGRGRAGAQVAQRPAGRRGQAGRGAGRGGVRRSRPCGGGRGHRDQRGLARARRRPGAPAWTTRGGTAQPVDRGSLLDRLLERPRPALRPARRRGRAGATLADEVRRRCATLGQEVRVDLAGRGVLGRGRRPSTTPAGWWSRPRRAPSRSAAGDVVHLRRPDQGREGAWGLG